MSQHRFENIIKALTYTNFAPPVYRDKFHQIWQLLEAFSATMKEVFIPSWLGKLFG
jgi:hypothetical protein